MLNFSRNLSKIYIFWTIIYNFSSKSTLIYFKLNKIFSVIKGVNKLNMRVILNKLIFGDLQNFIKTQILFDELKKSFLNRVVMRFFGLGSRADSISSKKSSPIRCDLMSLWAPKSVNLTQNYNPFFARMLNNVKHECICIIFCWQGDHTLR